MTDQSSHAYLADTTLPADWRGVRPCTCRLPRSNRVHDVPDPDPEAAVIDARILGETNELPSTVDGSTEGNPSP